MRLNLIKKKSPKLQIVTQIKNCEMQLANSRFVICEIRGNRRWLSLIHELYGRNVVANFGISPGDRSAASQLQTGKETSFFPPIRDFGMATVLEAQIESPKVTRMPQIGAALPTPRDDSIRPGSTDLPRVDECDQKGSPFDGLFIWISINCGLLLLGLHVYELLAWMIR